MFLTITLSTLPPKLMMESPKQGNPLLITWEENPNLLLFSFLPLIQQKLNARFKNDKALGPYSIPCDLLKLLSPYISSALVILINESFTTGIFPDKLKVAKVIALHKKGASDNPSNYRPISLLSIFSKIFERIMYKRRRNQ